MNDFDLKFSQFLSAELIRRIGKNPRYSLRAFAKYLDISPAALSLVLNRKRLPSRKLVAKLETTLKQDESLYRTYSKQVLNKRVKAPEHEIDLETFARVSTWVSYTILSLIKTKTFQPNPKWIAKRLSTSIQEVNESIRALESVGLLDRTKKKKWHQGKGSLRINNKDSNAFTRSFQKQLIEKALFSLENDPIEKRDIGSMTVSFSPKRLEEAKAFIRDFRLRFGDAFDEETEGTEVYNLTVQLIPFTV